MKNDTNNSKDNPLETLTDEKISNDIEEQKTDNNMPHQLLQLKNQEQLDNAQKKQYIDGDIAYGIGKAGLIFLVLGCFVYIIITKGHFYNMQISATVIKFISIAFSIINICYIYRAVKNYSESMILAAAIFTVMFNPWNLAFFVKHPGVTVIFLVIFLIHWSVTPVTKKIEYKHNN